MEREYSGREKRILLTTAVVMTLGLFAAIPTYWTSFYYPEIYGLAFLLSYLTAMSLSLIGVVNFVNALGQKPLTTKFEATAPTMWLLWCIHVTFIGPHIYLVSVAILFPHDDPSLVGFMWFVAMLVSGVCLVAYGFTLVPICRAFWADEFAEQDEEVTKMAGDDDALANPRQEGRVTDSRRVQKLLEQFEGTDNRFWRQHYVRAIERESTRDKRAIRAMVAKRKAGTELLDSEVELLLALDRRKSVSEVVQEGRKERQIRLKRLDLEQAELDVRIAREKEKIGSATNSTEPASVFDEDLRETRQEFDRRIAIGEALEQMRSEIEGMDLDEKQKAKLRGWIGDREFELDGSEP